MPDAIEKNRVIEILREMAILLELKDENVFKIRAYENAARSLEETPHDIAHLVETGELLNLKGIGQHIAGIITDLFREGRSKDYEALRKEFPDSLFELFRIPGLGPKRIKVLYEKLGIRSLDNLEKACQKNRLTGLDGFGEKTQERIVQGLTQVRKTQGLFLIDFAQAESAKITAYLARQKEIHVMEIAGSIRRRKEIIKDIDVLVTAKDPRAIHETFVKYPEAKSVIARGDTKSSILLKSGIACDLRTVSREEFPYALYYFTGSKEHNVAVRTIAKRKSIKINEYGLFKGKRKIRCADEAAIFKTLGYHYIPPELRENQGEIEFAAEHKIPPLIEESQIRGTFHVHSTYSDGRASLEAMVAACEAKGFEYVGISDHSQSARYANGLAPERLKKQWIEIDRLQKKYKMRIFRGIEVEILRSGKLDYSEAILSQFDFVIAAVHSQMNLPEHEMTERILRAMENRAVTFLAHPTGRLLLGREAYAVNVIRLIDEAKKLGVIMELNSHPQRLDLDWRMCRYAKEKGVGVSINPDAHDVEGIDHITYGIGIARKGWLEKQDVVNTLPGDKMQMLLKRRK